MNNDLIRAVTRRRREPLVIAAVVQHPADENGQNFGEPELRNDLEDRGWTV